jgi:hypothetical protein
MKGIGAHVENKTPAFVPLTKKSKKTLVAALRFLGYV